MMIIKSRNRETKGNKKQNETLWESYTCLAFLNKQSFYVNYIGNLVKILSSFCPSCNDTHLSSLILYHIIILDFLYIVSLYSINRTHAWLRSLAHDLAPSSNTFWHPNINSQSKLRNDWNGETLKRDISKFRNKVQYYKIIKKLNEESF